MWWKFHHGTDSCIESGLHLSLIEASDTIASPPSEFLINICRRTHISLGTICHMSCFLHNYIIVESLALIQKPYIIIDFLIHSIGLPSQHRPNQKFSGGTNPSKKYSTQVYDVSFEFIELFHVVLVSRALIHFIVRKKNVLGF